MRLVLKILLQVNLAWNLVHFRKSLIENLIESGHDVVALCPIDHTVPDLEAMGCRVVHLEMDNKGLSPRRDLGLVFRLWRHFRQECPDIILSYTIKNNIYGAFAARLLGIPFLPNVTGLGTAFLSSKLLERLTVALYRFAFRALPRVMFQNADDLDLFVERKIIKKDRSVLLPGSGIDLDHFVPEPLPEGRSKLVFLMISRLLRDKGVLEFVEAARQLRAQGVPASFQILGPVGADNRTAIGRDTVESWVAEGVVEYLGATTDVRPFIAAADCVVLPSYREGMPRVLLEAAAMGRPCITTDVPGCRGAVDDGVTGLLCKPGDAEDLARAMHAIVDMDPHTRQEMGRAGRTKMEREFDQDRVVDIYRREISNITGQVI